MRNVFNKGFMLAGILMLAMMLGACSAKTTGNGGETAAAGNENSSAPGSGETLETVTLNIVYPGDPQPDQDAVTAELEKKLAEDGIPVKLNYQYIPWGDYFQKLPIMLSTGNQVDIMWTDPNLLGTFVKSNSIAPLDEALSEHGADITAALDSKYWPPVTVNGKKYGVPAGALGTTKGYYTATIRKDLREKYGLLEIKTLDDLLAYAEAIKTNNPEMLVFNEPPAAFHRGEVLQSTSIDGIVFNYETLKAEAKYDRPDTMEDAKFLRMLYEKGYIDKDVMVGRDIRADFNSGKAAIGGGDVYEYNNYSRNIAVPGAELEFIKILLTNEPYMPTTTWNFQSIAATSKHIDRAVMFLNWIQKNEENYDIMTNGIKGTHYELKDGTIMTPEGVDAASIGYAPPEWMWQNPEFLKPKASDASDFMQQLQQFDQNTKLYSPIMGFNFDQTPVKTEIAAISTIENKYKYGIASGVLDPEENISKYQAELNKAGLPKVMEEYQKQVDEFLAASK
ncbi:extracellular solute-binding protein [Paenibacillus sp. J5C_2022]|uniref:extracellular solute-binding protein n=1 Tax=Paenibacillus sp. J5C2022 TaxID=2977129 RepID=UPI0021D2B3EA|nr:extracellular solute-binding protein [Paenibacillus sp. J5C2022]MCU6708597.1 extracellular solute-binding protein [Paenibacillus sp. J5C2022]